MTEDLRSTPLYQFMRTKCSIWRENGYWYPSAYVNRFQMDLAERELAQEFVQDANFAWGQICGLLRNKDSNFIFAVLNAIAEDVGFEWGLTATLVHNALLAACNAKRGETVQAAIGGALIGVAAVGGVALVSQLLSEDDSPESETPAQKESSASAEKRKGSIKK